jgi:hypothetical protein
MAVLRKVLLAGGFMALASATAVGDWDDDGSGLEGIMGPEQYEAAGLHKLTESERRALYLWLRERGWMAPTSPAAPPGDGQAAALSGVPEQVEGSGAVQSPDEAENFGFPEPPPDPLDNREALRASVLQPFRGWDGKTVFHLDNGQVWQQRRSGRFTYRGDDTRVVITKNSWGFYELRLIDADRSVGVKRLK